MLFQIPQVIHPLGTFKPGDHVRVWRGFYWHHAIYIGDGWLIEFGSSLLGGPVAHVTWDDFARDGIVKRVTHERSFQPAEIVARAESRFGEKGFFLLTHNCEHFARWCATGQWESPQAQVAGVALVCLALLAASNPKAVRQFIAS